jgi:hypothetical protein
MIHCFVWCYCDGQQDHRSRANGLIPYGENVYIDTSNYGYVLIYGPSASPSSSTTILSAGLARPQVQRVIDLSRNRQSSDSSSRSTSTKSTQQGGPSSPPSAGAIQLFNPPNPDPVAGQCNSECSTNVACSYDDTAASGNPDINSCGVCELGPPTRVKDAVYPPGRCAQAVAVDLVMGAASLMGRDVNGNISTTNVSMYGNLSHVLPPLPQYNLTNPTACACNASFVHLLCCAYHNGSLPADVGQSLGAVEVSSA